MRYVPVALLLVLASLIPAGAAQLAAPPASSAGVMGTVPATPTPDELDWTLPNNGLAVIRCPLGSVAMSSRVDTQTVNVVCQALPSATPVGNASGGTQRTAIATATAGLSQVPTATATPLPASPTVGSESSTGAMTIYQVTNPNSVSIRISHTFSNGYTFWSSIPPRATATYHVRDIPSVPSPFNGNVKLAADHPFTSWVIGYDYP